MPDLGGESVHVAERAQPLERGAIVVPGACLPFAGELFGGELSRIGRDSDDWGQVDKGLFQDPAIEVLGDGDSEKVQQGGREVVVVRHAGGKLDARSDPVPVADENSVSPQWDLGIEVVAVLGADVAGGEAKVAVSGDLVPPNDDLAGEEPGQLPVVEFGVVSHDQIGPRSLGRSDV